MCEDDCERLFGRFGGQYLMVCNKILSLAFTSLNLYLSVVCPIQPVMAWRVGHSRDECLKKIHLAYLFSRSVRKKLSTQASSSYLLHNFVQACSWPVSTLFMISSGNVTHPANGVTRGVTAVRICQKG